MTNAIAFYNVKKALLDNKLVREAISLAIPYEENIKLNEGSVTSSSGSITKGLWGYRDDLKVKFNLEKAKELLKQAGYENKKIKLALHVLWKRLK
jgi:peptide/nickel transport system substrate-binding protein